MSTTEFERSASHWRRLCDLDRSEAVSAACRGSGNPAVLAWLAEALELDGTTSVVDIGGGLGGPCAWLEDHYECTSVTVDPVTDAARAAGEIFGIPSVVADGAALPLADGSFDAALLLGVLSVVADPVRILGEAGRVARRLGVIAYCSTGSDDVLCGGSRFGTRGDLEAHLASAGWHVGAGPEAPSFPPLPTWTDATLDDGRPVDADEHEVAAALDDGRIEPVVAAADRT